MDILNISAGGITLHGAPGSTRNEDTSKPSVKPVQAMRLDLEDGVLDNIVRTARSGGKGVHLSFGKNITLDYGNRSKQLSSTVQHTPTELYTYTDGEEAGITFTALQSHRLAMRKAQEETQGTDIALAKLQNQLASAEREKQSRQIQLAPNNIGLPPAVSRRNAAKTSKTLSAARSNKQPRMISSIYSAANSPSLGAARSPHNLEAVTSEPLVEDVKAQKSMALKIPLIHFLAVRPVSEKYLGQALRCDQKDLQELLQKVGRPYRLDPSKWDLNDRAFKELDIWQFAYPTADDRQLAIDRAVSSYDRQRLSRNDPLWQKLLPYHERNKGKVLSTLDLSKPKPQKSATPRIHVQSTDDSVVAHGTPGPESDARHDRLAPSDAEMKAKSKSKPSKTLAAGNGSESDVRSKGSLSKEVKKLGQAPKTKEKPLDKPSNVRKGARKAAATKIEAKSSEFVHDSDEEEDDHLVNARAPKIASKIASKTASKTAPNTQNASTAIARRIFITEDDDIISDAPAPKEKSSTPKPAKAGMKGTGDAEAPKSMKAKPVATTVRRKVAQEAQQRQKPTQSPAKAAEKRPPSFGSSSSGSKQASNDSSQTSVPVSKSLSRQRTTSSPHKPSPLGSSPPTNASDLDNNSRPISSTSSTPLISHGRAPQPESTKSPRVAQDGSIALNSINRLTQKRKATDDDADIHLLDKPLTNGTSVTSGHSSSTKRHKASPISPPTSESSMDGLTNARKQVLEQAQRFQTVWNKYRTLYKEVAALPKEVPNKKVDDLMKLHQRLEGMKADIAKAALH